MLFQWVIFCPNVDIDTGVNFDKTQNCNNDLFADELNNSCLFTDDSKIQESEFIGFSVISPEKDAEIYKRSVKYASIFSLEAMVLLNALSYAESISSKRITIFSDSKLVLSALSKINFKGNINYLIYKIRYKMKYLYNAGKKIQIIWIPLWHFR